MVEFRFIRRGDQLANLLPGFLIFACADQVLDAWRSARNSRVRLAESYSIFRDGLAGAHYGIGTVSAQSSGINHARDRELGLIEKLWCGNGIGLEYQILSFRFVRLDNEGLRSVVAVTCTCCMQRIFPRRYPGNRVSSTSIGVDGEAFWITLLLQHELNVGDGRSGCIAHDAVHRRIGHSCILSG